MFLCHNCKTVWKGEGKPGREETCESCDFDLRCCLNCQFYDGESYNDCREPQAERILYKEKANFCGYFAFIKTLPQEEQGEKVDPKKAFEDLFK